MQKLSDSNSSHDFYDIYYKWSKDPQHDYRDLTSFHRYLINLINAALFELKMVTVGNQKFTHSSNSYDKVFDDLRQFKASKRPLRVINLESVQTDINNVSYVLSARKKSGAQTLLHVNDFLVSADQLLMTWAEQTYPGIPVVVIPSTWLSIILRFSGRTSDDYKSYCLFMSLRHRRENNDEVPINKEWIMTTLNSKTSDVSIKEKIITELTTNRVDYSFEGIKQHGEAVDLAFDKIIVELKKANALSINAVKDELIDTFQRDRSAMEQKLAETVSHEEIIMIQAQNRASRKVDKWKRLSFLQSTLPVFCLICGISISVMFFFEIPVIVLLANRLGMTIAVTLTMVFSLLPVAIANVLKYLSSDERHAILVKKYRTILEKDLNYRK